MKKLFTLLFTVVLAVNFAYAQPANKKTLYFDPGKYTLTDDSKNELQNFIKTLPKNCNLAISGYTDSDGSAASNLTLSQKRAKAVHFYFITQGFEKKNIKTEFYGEEQPVAQNNSKDGKQLNRRVEISIGKMIIADVLKKTDKQPQRYTASSSNDITITGKEGTQITILKNTLIKQNGEGIKGNVHIELKEFYKKSDMVLANLHTMSDNRLLETGGMIYISVTSAGEKLKLSPGSNIEIQFPAPKITDGMQTFIGEEHAMQVNWKPRSMESKKEVITNVWAPGTSDSIAYKEYYKEYKEKARVNNVILNAANLGWINCDRFTNYSNNTNLIIETNLNATPIVYLVFKDINAIMPGYLNQNNQRMFFNIPVGQKATLIAMSFVNDQPLFASKDIVISKNQTEGLKLIKTTLSALHNDLKVLLD